MPFGWKKASCHEDGKGEDTMGGARRDKIMKLERGRIL
jgi:hypothetical protein